MRKPKSSVVKLFALFNEKPVAVFVLGGILLLSGFFVVNASLSLFPQSVTSDSALTLSAGGTNQNVILTPSGTGFTVLNGNVGIGTTTPMASLHIAGTPILNSTSSLVLLGNSPLSGAVSNTSGTFVGINSASNFGGDFLNFQKNGTNVIRLSNEGGFFMGDGAGLLDYFPTVARGGIIASINDARINEAVPFSVFDYFDIFPYYTPTTSNPGMTLNGATAGAILPAGSSGAINQLNGFSVVTHNLGATNISSGIVGINGMAASTWNAGSGLVNAQSSLTAIAANTGSGRVGTSTAIFIESPSNDAGNNNVTTTIGVYIQDQNRGTNRWNIYSEGATSKNYFAGSIGIGTTTPVTALHITGATTPTLRVGGPTIAGCLEILDSAGNGTINYITSSAGVLVSTTTKPAVCQ